MFNASSVGNLTNFPYLMWYLMTAPPFSLPTKPYTPHTQAIAGERKTLNCSAAILYTNDSISLLMWYKNDFRTPIYTIDSRKTVLATAKHFPTFDEHSRIYFNVSMNPPSLVLNPVVQSDEGLYMCQVEYKKSPTIRQLILLNVTVLPKRLVITNETGHEVPFVIGPFFEGFNITLYCTAKGGIPSPAVSWWHESMLVDSSYTVMDDGAVINGLTLLNLQRGDLGATYTCLASNTNLSVPLSSYVTIDMYLKPLGVEIIPEHQPLHASKTVKLCCRSWGAKPSATLTWLLDDEVVKHGNETFTQDDSISCLTFAPEPGDNGKKFFCKSGNTHIFNSTVMEEREITVFYLPALKVTAGTNVNLDKIVEGMDLYFECHVNANPPVDEVFWYFGRQLLDTNTSAGIIASNQSLALQNVRKEQRGHYQCFGANIIGSSWSEPIVLRIKFAPVCRYTSSEIIAASLNDDVEIDCSVDSYPAVYAFRWTLERGNLSFPLNATTRSIHLVLRSAKDYGIVNCWATNDIGTQKDPCSAILIPEELPKPPESCSVERRSKSCIFLQCKSNSSVRAKQLYHLEILDLDKKEITNNISSENVPVFLINGTEDCSRLRLILYSSNRKGRSDSISLLMKGCESIALSDSTEKQEFQSDSKIVKSVIGIVGSLVALFVLVTIFLIVRTRKRKEHKSIPAAPGELECDGALHKNNYSAPEDNVEHPVEDGTCDQHNEICCQLFDKRPPCCKGGYNSKNEENKSDGVFARKKTIETRV